MRDAIQGMLSMSRLGGMSISSSSSYSNLSPANRGRLLVPKQSPRAIAADDIELQMANCYKDDEFGRVIGFCAVFLNILIFCYLRLCSLYTS